MPTQEKIDLVTSLKKRFEEAHNIFITDYAGLNVEQITRLRKNLRDHGVKYVVAKNTLMRIAARETGYDDMVPLLSGPTAIAFSALEPNIPARILYDAFLEFDKVKKPEVKGFFIEKQSYGAADAERIAKLPSREVLLSQLVSVVEGPIAGLIGTLDGVMRELVGTIEALSAKKAAG